jgi:hypothetical protein
MTADEILKKHEDDNEMHFVGMILGISQWQLLEKMQRNELSEVEIMHLEHILKRDIKENNLLKNS